MVSNLYVHFPFCRRKCTYCALPSKAIKPDSGYVGSLADKVPPGPFKTVYFGGGTPALCNLNPILGRIAGIMEATGVAPEWTVELHPLDVKSELLENLKAFGVNRISMGVQSFDDRTLRDMGRGYTVDFAHRAFDLVKRHFDNAGIDLIVGYPDDSWEVEDWGFTHASVYSLIEEPESILGRQKRTLPGDDEVLDRIREVSAALAAMGLRRYEISSYARAGMECKHNLAVWRGEDYLGIGDGAVSGLNRDPREKMLSLRTRSGLDTAEFPQWRNTLDFYVRQDLLVREGLVYRLTERGTEVCDSILAELV